MKIVRFGPRGAEKPGVIDDKGDIRNLSAYIDDWSYKTLNKETLEEISASVLSACPWAPKGSRLRAPIVRVGKIVGCALTYC